MPQTPFPISGTIYGLDSQPLSGVAIDVYNLRTQNKLSTITDDNGTYIVDLANMNANYTDKDKIFIRAYRNLTYFECAEKVREIVASDNSLTQNLYLDIDLPAHEIIHPGKTESREHNPITSGKNVTTQDVLDQYEPAESTKTGTYPQYFGFVDIKGNWYIQKTSDNAGARTYKYARGNARFEANWAVRTTLTYDYFHKVF